MKRVYIAHPLRGNGVPGWDDHAKNFERYMKFVASATLKGHLVISWAHFEILERDLGIVLPGEFYLERDLVLLSMADEVWQCGPLEVSEGLREEISFAQRHAISVIHYERWNDPNYVPSPQVLP